MTAILSPAPVRTKLSAGERAIRRVRERLRAAEERAARSRLQRAEASLVRQLLAAEEHVRALDLALQQIRSEMPPDTLAVPEANGWHEPQPEQPPAPKYGTISIGDAVTEMSKEQLDHFRAAMKAHGKRKGGEIEDGLALAAALGALEAETFTVSPPRGKPVTFTVADGTVTFTRD